jgi:hypothetical protein
MTDQQIAELCHEANRAYCRIAMHDETQKPWNEAAEWQRESAVNGVAFARSGGATPAEQHAAWSADKFAAGWVFGPEKNPDAVPPTHPCLVPYDELPVAQQRKDALFQAIVAACTA